MTTAEPTIERLRVRPVDVPMARPLATSGGSVTSAPLVLIDLETSEGITGHSYIFCYAPFALPSIARLLEALGERLAGESALPAALDAVLQRTFRLFGTQGFAAMAMAGLDMAAWDALARSADLPLARLLGGAPRPIPAYNSNGLGIIGAEKAGPEAVALADGFGAVKVRLGYADAAADVAVVRAVRAAVGDDVTLMSDYNQCLTVAEAGRRLRHLDGEGLAWVEEPIRCDDYAGYARLRDEAATPMQLGESFWGPHEMAKAIEAGAGNYLMPDAMKIGGVTGWLRAAALAEPHGIPLSSHLFPEISAHLLAATPNAHWLEYVDWANPILAEPLAVANGQVTAPDRPGSGIEWDETAVEKYAV